MTQYLNDVIKDAVRAPYELRRCVYCRTVGIFAGDYPIPINARGDTFAHFIERDQPPEVDA